MAMASPENSDVSPVDYLRALKRANQDPGAATASTALNPAQGNTGASPAGERRRAPRYRCSGSVEFRAAGGDVRTWATITDISQTGCYVEMQATSPPDTEVDMGIEVGGVRVRVKGKVRVTYPFLGMGIAFTELTAEEGAKLDGLLLQLGRLSSSPASSSMPEETEVTLDITAIADPEAALHAIVQFFRSRSLLSRDEFLDLTCKSQSSSTQRG